MQKILFVEDDPTLQKTLCLSLEKEGYEVKPAMDGEIGLSTAKEMKPDLILLDLILPKLDGFEVLAELKKDEAKNFALLFYKNLCLMIILLSCFFACPVGLSCGVLLL